MTITFDSKAYKAIDDKMNAILALLKVQNARQGLTKYISEDEVIHLTKLSKSSLQKKRNKGILRYSTATGRKLQYLRSDVEAYVNGCPRMITVKANKDIA